MNFQDSFKIDKLKVQNDHFECQNISEIFNKLSIRFKFYKEKSSIMIKLKQTFLHTTNGNEINPIISYMIAKITYPIITSTY